jgi:hypothetical protein
MSSALLSMSLEELDRVDLMRRIHERRLTQRKAAALRASSTPFAQRLARARACLCPRALPRSRWRKTVY